ncbi:MAG: LysM peptidoglycan-binding domain-containing protein [Candidatus Omnitrophica bacterium]|nr:LysM peptidoglycan-binding domain-containing protein [Candidatus Omnitrophota bacterium]
MKKRDVLFCISVILLFIISCFFAYLAQAGVMNMVEPAYTAKGTTSMAATVKADTSVSTWTKPNTIANTLAGISQPAKTDSVDSGKGDTGSQAKVPAPQGGGGDTPKNVDPGKPQEQPQQGGGTNPVPPSSAPQSQVVLIVYFDPSLDNPPNSGNYQGGSFSGGIPIGPYTILTAGHSASMMRPGDPRSAYTYGPYFGSNLGSGIAMDGDVDHIIYAPGNLDLAIVVFRSPISGGTPVSIAPANSLQPGDTVQVFFEQNLAAGSTNIQVDSLGQDSAPAYHGGMTWDNYPNASFSTWQTPTAAGDSGFPVLNQSGQVVGVVHGEINYPIGGSFDLFMNVTQPAINQWVVNNANAQPNSPPPSNPAPVVNTVPQTNSAPVTNNAYQPAAQPVQQNSGGSTYTVQAGDNLFRIALNHGTTLDALRQANGLGDSNIINPGQVLVIPGS